MKNEIRFLKVLSLIFALMLMNRIYSQSPCGSTYDYSVTGTATTCTDTFYPDIPVSPAVCNITWIISSAGDYGVACDLTEFDTDTLIYKFCFDGYFAITMRVYFCGGGYCDVTKTLYISCLEGDECDPDPERASTPADPTVEITYIKPDTCAVRNLPVNGCMYSFTGSQYIISCGWKWALRVPPSAYDCHAWTYYVTYERINSCGSHTCVTTALDTHIICINAYIDQTIYIVATAASCCLPDGYQRGKYWTPSPAGGVYNNIVDPSNTISTYCTAYRDCPSYTYCVSNPIALDQTSGWPATPCFSGGSKDEQRNAIHMDKDLMKEQNVIIYNVQGVEVFNGKWKFGDPSRLNLNWPEQIGSGIYIISFDGKKLSKLFKSE